MQEVIEEKCYRDLQTHSEIGGLSLFELIALLAVPILLFPIFTLLDISFLFILLVEIAMFFLFRLANKLSPFNFGLASYVFYHFIWPRKLSAYKLEEHDYLIKQPKP
ncbi:MAG: hypothetical protein D6814_04570 [Calditrichaeota bacterium]|nr:MAG: hypothetical protein D6814_04570 [Calditrichota bacterium]